MKRVPTPASESIAAGEFECQASAMLLTKAAQAKKDEDIVAGSLKLTLKDPVSLRTRSHPMDHSLT